jgi:hypothetical protein
MTDLKELVVLIDHHLPGVNNALGQGLHAQSKLRLLYTGILSGQFQSDEEAAAFLYPSENRGSSYRKLKVDLRDRLVNTLFDINLKQAHYNEYQKAYYECHKQFTAIKILFGRNANVAGVNLALKLLRQSSRFEFTHLCLDLCSLLRLHFGTRVGDIARFEEYNLLFHQYNKSYQLENLAEELYISLAMNYVNSKETKESMYNKALFCYNQIREEMVTEQSYRFQLYARLIQLSCYTTLNDYLGALAVCRDAIKAFRKKDFEAHVPLQIFHYQELVCFLQLKNYTAGEEAAQNCLHLMGKGSYNWFKYLELYFQLSMHAQNYEVAYTTYIEAIHNERFEFLPENVQELWKIYAAYLYFLMRINKITPKGKNDPIQKFRISKLLNETPLYAKDKRGMNISILVIQILIYIIEKKYDTVINCTESIGQYCYRYFRKEDTQRGNLFIKMLLQIPQNDFDADRIKVKSKKYWDKLAALPLALANQSHEIEIIPFEDLWRFIQENLDKKIIRTKNVLATKSGKAIENNEL